MRDFNPDGRDSLPAQTRHYVRNITGRSVEEWAALGRETGKERIVATSCRFLTALLKELPAFSIGPIERKLRDAAFGAEGIPNGRNASAGQSPTNRVTAGPMGTGTARNKQIRTASLPATAARSSSGRSTASPDSKRSSGAPASSIKQTSARTRVDQSWHRSVRELCLRSASCRIIPRRGACIQKEALLRRIRNRCRLAGIMQRFDGHAAHGIAHA